MLLMINVIFYRMVLTPFRMATSERYEHCIVHTVFEHYIMNFVLFNFVVLTRCLLYLNMRHYI